ncbi:MAG: hypothetical protein VW397_05085 [Candidatus Margulisiibacteriota bacterium]
MINAIKDKLRELNPHDFSLKITIFFIIIHFQEIVDTDPLIFIPLIILSAVGILFNKALYSKLYWGAISALYFTWLMLNWQVIDNHMYLWGYWLMSIFLSLFSKLPKKTLAFSAQLLIGFCMLFASIQKLNPTFLSGDFFYYTLITDRRFFFIGPLIKFNMIEVISENIITISEMMSHSKNVILNPGPYILHPISKFLTWYVIILESTLAIIFLIPRRFAYQWQHWLLFLFFSVYLLLPIRGFAFTLIAMGTTLIKKEDIGLKLGYIIFLLYMFAMSNIVISLIFNFTYPIF